MDNYRLEYNERQGGFHFDNGSHEENTFGWVTLCKNISDKQAMEFAENMREKYPATDWMNEDREPRDYPSLKLIKIEFENFLRSVAKI